MENWVHPVPIWIWRREKSVSSVLALRESLRYSFRVFACTISVLCTLLYIYVCMYVFTLSYGQYSRALRPPDEDDANITIQGFSNEQRPLHKHQRIFYSFLPTTFRLWHQLCHATHQFVCPFLHSIPQGHQQKRGVRWNHTPRVNPAHALKYVIAAISLSGLVPQGDVRSMRVVVWGMWRDSS